MPTPLPRRGPRVRAALALTLAAGVLAAGVLGLALAGPAGAATAAPRDCPQETVSTHTKQARAVFTGTVDSVAREATGTGRREATFVAQVSVERVYKTGRDGISSETTEVVTQRLIGQCSLGKLDVGARYVFFTSLSDGRFVATGQGGTALADADLVAQVERLLGRGRSPVPPEKPTATFTRVDDHGVTRFTRAAAPGAALVLVGLLGLVVTRRLGRRPAD